MTIINSIVLGIIEGLTEFLPISSTAHLILAGEWLKIPSSEFLKTFEISIQLGAILAVVILYWKKIWSSWNLIFKIGAAFLTTSIIGLALYKIVKTYFMENNYLIASTLLIGGIFIIIFEKYYLKKQNNKLIEVKSETNISSTIETQAKNNTLESMTYSQAIKIGAAQSLAMIPGVSRSAATIIGGLSLGIKREEIVEFSFLLAIPTMLAATALDLYKSQATLSLLSSNDISAWVIGFIVSFITAIIGIKFFIKFIQKNNFSPFGWYRIFLALVVFAWLIL